MNPLHGRFAALYCGTPAEHALEPAVAALGRPYRTNFPLYLYEGGLRFYPDFVIPSLGLVIEVDGPSHRGKDEEDDARSRELFRVYGWITARCTNEEALTDPFGTVARLIQGTSPGPASPLGLPARRTRPSKSPARRPRLSKPGKVAPARAASRKQ